MGEIIGDHYRVPIGSQVVEIPLVPIGPATAISLLMTIDHGVRFGETAGADLAEAIADTCPEIVASAATLGIPVAIEVSRHLGLDEYLILHDVHSPGWVVVADGLIESVGGGPPPVELTGPTFLDWLLGTCHSGLALAGPDDCALAVAAVRAATLAAGVTTMVDSWSVAPVADRARAEARADASIEAHRASGGRTVFGVMGNEHPAPGWATTGARIDIDHLCRPADETLAEVERLAATHHLADGGRTLVTPSPELPETSTPGGLTDAMALAEWLGTVLPMHLCASPPGRAAYGPAELERDGLATLRLLAAHLSAIEGGDVQALGRAGPASASPTAPVRPVRSARALSRR